MSVAEHIAENDAARLCNRLTFWNGEPRLCDGELSRWRGTDGHGGGEWFYTCKKCGARR